jgi:hypothetical protein
MVEEVWVVESTGDNARKLADGGFPSWAPDAKTVYFHDRRLRKLMSIRVDVAEPEVSEVMDMPYWYPSISPDGKQVAYRSADRLVTADLESGKVVKTYRLPAGGRGFLGNWSADGLQIGFGGYGDHDIIGLWVLTLENGQAKRLSTGSFTMPAWSPDGSRMVCDHRTRGSSEIWLFETKVLDELEPMEIPSNLYVVPAGSVGELLNYIKEVRDHRPQTVAGENEYRRKAPGALKVAAERILRVETNQWSPAYQMALRVLLEDRVRTARDASDAGQQELITLMKMFLTARLQGERLNSEDTDLAELAAEALRDAGKPALAAEAYEEFGKLISQSESDGMKESARKMQATARKLKSTPD